MYDIVIPFLLWIYGLIFGSFYNVCISRIPKGKSVISPPSHCPKCKKRIPWYHNIPVISYIALRGKCGNCGLKISFIYPFVEMLSGFVLLILYFYLKQMHPEDWVIRLGIYYVFSSGLIMLSFIDYRYYIIPDRFTIGGIAAGIFFSVLYPELHGYYSSFEGFVYSSLSSFICFGVLSSIRTLGTVVYKREAMGFGDVKLAGAFGAFLGWKLGLFSIFAGALVGTVGGVLSVIFSKLKWRSEIPFGPYLALGAFLSLLFGNSFFIWYLNALVIV